MESRRQRRERERKEAKLAAQTAKASTIESKERVSEVLTLIGFACSLASWGWSVIAPNSSAIFGSILLFIAVFAMVAAIRRMWSLGKVSLACVTIVALLGLVAFDWYIVVKPQRGKPFQALLVHGYHLTSECGSLTGKQQMPVWMKKASLAYQEGVYRVDTKTRLRALLFGSGGPIVIVGKAVTQGVHETELSRRLRPPMKWSYLKLLSWTVVIFFTVLIVYVHSVMESSTKVSVLPAELGMFGVATGFLLLLFLVWRHNHLAYPRRFAKWNDSWLCERCGGVSSQRPG
jgi:hypothetical protein